MASVSAMGYSSLLSTGPVTTVNSGSTISLNNFLSSVSRSDQFSAIILSIRLSTFSTGSNLLLNIAMNASTGLNVRKKIALAITLNGNVHTAEIVSRLVNTVTVQMMIAVKT